MPDRVTIRRRCKSGDDVRVPIGDYIQQQRTADLRHRLQRECLDDEHLGPERDHRRHGRPPQNADVTVNGTTYTYAIQSGDTPTTIAAGLASVMVADGVTGTTSSGAVLTVGGSNPPTAASANVTNTAAYATDFSDDRFRL